MDALWRLLQDEWPKILWGIVPVAVTVFGVWRVRRAWRRRDTLNRLCVTLNRVIDGTLSFRTLLEVALADALLNRYGEKVILKAAAQCRPGQPFLELNDDSWYAHNAVLNVISERFAEGFVYEAMGLPVVKQRFLLALTNEVDGPVRTHKLRAQVVAEDLLKKFGDEEYCKNLKIEKPHHSVRIATLQKMYAAWRMQKSDHGYVLPVEIAVPKLPGDSWDSVHLREAVNLADDHQT